VETQHEEFTGSIGDGVLSERLVHMLLDSVVGDVRWFAPLSDRFFSIATVPAIHQPWWLNFFLHWSFLLELALVGTAVAMWRMTREPVDTAA